MLYVQKNGETINHLMLHCKVIWPLWEDVFRWLELTWVMLAIVVELLASWISLGNISQITIV